MIGARSVLGSTVAVCRYFEVAVLLSMRSCLVHMGEQLQFYERLSPSKLQSTRTMQLLVEHFLNQKR